MALAQGPLQGSRPMPCGLKALEGTPMWHWVRVGLRSEGQKGGRGPCNPGLPSSGPTIPALPCLPAMLPPTPLPPPVSIGTGMLTGSIFVVYLLCSGL